MMPFKSAFESASSHLIKHYPAAFTDFRGTPSNTPCIYKSGPAWPLPSPGPEAYPYLRELRPVPTSHPIASSWVDILRATEALLDESGVNFSVIAGFGMGNQGEKDAFCEVLLCVGVCAGSVGFEQARRVAEDVKREVLDAIGFGNVDVAIKEWATTRLVGSSASGADEAKHTECRQHPLKAEPTPKSKPQPKLYALDRLPDSIPDLRHPFTSTLPLSIAPLAYPSCEGTAGLYFRLNEDSDDIFLLSSAHVVRAPRKMSIMSLQSPLGQEVVLLGNIAYEAALSALSAQIRDHECNKKKLQANIKHLEARQAKGENPGFQQDSKDIWVSLQIATRALERISLRISALEELCSEVSGGDTSNGWCLNQRKTGFVSHVRLEDPISTWRDGLGGDWAAVKLYRDRFSFSHSQSQDVKWAMGDLNKVYVADTLDELEFGALMYPLPEPGFDRVSRYPDQGLLKMTCAMPASELAQFGCSFNNINSNSKPEDKSKGKVKVELPCSKGDVDDAFIRSNANGELHPPEAARTTPVPVLKSGSATGTTVGWLNGLAALVRYGHNYDHQFYANGSADRDDYHDVKSSGADPDEIADRDEQHGHSPPSVLQIPILPYGYGHGPRPSLKYGVSPYTPKGGGRRPRCNDNTQEWTISGAFAAEGDAGAMVLDGLGKVVGMVVGGCGDADNRDGTSDACDEVDLTFVVPFYELERQVREVYPGSLFLSGT